MEYIRWEWKIPDDRDLLKILFKGELITGALNFRFFFRDFMVFMWIFWFSRINFTQWGWGFCIIDYYIMIYWHSGHLSSWGSFSYGEDPKIGYHFDLELLFEDYFIGS